MRNVSACGLSRATPRAPPLSGTPSAAAASLLQQAVPGQSGDTEQIVFQTNTGTVDDPAVESQITAMLGRVSHLPDVSSVTSPYTPAGAQPSGAGQISASKTVAFATVNFRVDANSVSAAEATQFVNTARAPNSAHLQVDVVGNVAASTNPTSSSSTLIGVAAALVVLLLFFGAILPALLPLLGTAVALVAGLSVVNMLSNSLSMASFTPSSASSSGSGSASTTPCSSSPAPATGCAAGFRSRTRSPLRAAPPAGPCCSRA